MQAQTRGRKHGGFQGNSVIWHVSPQCALIMFLCMLRRGLHQGAGAQELAYMEDGAADPKLGAEAHMGEVGNGHDPAVTHVATH